MALEPGGELYIPGSHQMDGLNKFLLKVLSPQWVQCNLDTESDDRYTQIPFLWCLGSCIFFVGCPSFDGHEGGYSSE